ncbi:hypothetical protein FDUTEX481_07374 [Tolypothrix sp. PCC 7601]|nr:hypothetical protein FDUTEX481_07374 [Tolypothrix sp. PCC 7601]
MDAVPLQRLYLSQTLFKLVSVSGNQPNYVKNINRLEILTNDK